jgi:hypothetical protein
MFGWRRLGVVFAAAVSGAAAGVILAVAGTYAYYHLLTGMGNFEGQYGIATLFWMLVGVIVGPIVGTVWALRRTRRRRPG